MQMNQRNTERGATNGPTAPANLLKTKLRHGNWLSLGAGLLATLLLLFALPALHAQTTAQISGIVTDNTGAVIPGANVALVNEATQDTRVVKSNGEGLYSFPALLPSSYTIKVSAKGFEPKTLTGLVLHAGDERSVPAFALAIGS
jgi:Carboxypeptidase regulatory-like domain